MSEDRLQQECYMWYHNKYPEYRGLLFHVPNGGARNAREGAKFKSMGVYPGVSDFLFMGDGKTACIELKTKVGKLSKKQEKWRDLVNEQGFKYFVVRTLPDFRKVIRYLMNNEIT